MNDADREERERIRKLSREERLELIQQRLAEAERLQQQIDHGRSPDNANLPRGARFDT